MSQSPLGLLSCLYFAWFIIYITVGEHHVQICNTFFHTIVIIRFEPFLDRAKIHGIFDDQVIILQRESHAT